MPDNRFLYSGTGQTGNLPPPMCTTGPARLELTLTPSGDRCTVTVIGTLDEWSIPAVDTQYDQLLGAGYHEVVLDVTGVHQVDESGVIALTHLWARLRKSGVFCRIRGLAPGSGWPDRSIAIDAADRIRRGYPPPLRPARTHLKMREFLGFAAGPSGKVMLCLCPHRPTDRTGLRFRWTEAGDAFRKRQPPCRVPRMPRSAGETSRVGDVSHPHR